MSYKVCVPKPTLICITQGDYGQSCVSQYGQIEADEETSYGVYARCIDEHEVAEHVFQALVEDLQRDGLITKDRQKVIKRVSRVSDFPPDVAQWTNLAVNGRSNLPLYPS